jgi:UDP-N-acetylglucosamine--N-acetylmuramyl-(pentapeptide) pyrophosphoryl-undecaprenol N-acetylglucosamine transferase
MTLTELKATGRASILIPFPQAAENHQYYNALTMSKNGAAILIEDKDLTAERLLAEVQALYNDRERLKQMGESAASLNIPDSTDRVISNILDLVK